MTAVCDVTMINVRTVRCDKLEHGDHDACWRGRDNGAVSVSYRLVPSCGTHSLCSCPKGCPRLHQLPASRQANKGIQEGLAETTTAYF
jgi:hypothetical protein